MHVVSRKRLNAFVKIHPNAKAPLNEWYLIVKRSNFASFAELRLAFGAADRVGKLTVFNIGGNNFRLIAAIHYNRKRIYVRSVLTHEDYNDGKWRE